MTNGALDRLSGIVFVVLGLLVTLGAWSMPRFEDQGGVIYQAPGLTPGLLGVALALCGAVLALRRGQADSDETTFWSSVFGVPANRNRALAAGALTITYGALMFGTLPYVPATFLFVTAFVLVFEIALTTRTDHRPVMTVALVAIGLGAATSFGTQFLFQSLFLIQLP